MATFKYNAVQVQQQPGAEPFYLFGAPAEQILEWCDVPRKKADFMAGYQRELKDRQEKVTEFIEKSPDNVVPGSVIVAVPEEDLKISTTSQDGVFQVVIDTSDKSFDERLSALAEAFLSRLSESERSSISSSEIADFSGTDDLDLEEEESPEESPPESYLAGLTSELLSAVKDFGSLTTDRQSAVREYIEGVSKPGRILDGQHRVFGSKNVADFDVVLPVVLMPGLSTSEQVFHFYVLNNKAKPLKPTELRGTVSTSLTNQEIEDLYDRFKQAGVLAEEARWTHRANTESHSPFVGLIDFGFESTGAFIPENVAHQVIGKFVKLTRKYKLLYSGVAGWMDDPDYDYRLKMFYALWTVVQKKYGDVWSDCVKAGGGQLLMKASMLVLQELLLDTLNQEMPRRAVKKETSPLADIDDFKTSVEAGLHFLPEEFFSKQWQEKGLDTSAGRKLLRSQMDQAIQKGGTKIGHLPLFKKK